MESMKDKDIQQLIDKYLEGETSPAEESLLARALYRHEQKGGEMPEEWQTIRLMLGEWAMGEAAYDEMMSERQQNSQRITPLGTQHGGRLWRKLAVAASLLLLFGIGASLLFRGSNSSSSTDTLTQAQDDGKDTGSQPEPSVMEEEGISETVLPGSASTLSPKEKHLVAENKPKVTRPQTASQTVAARDDSRPHAEKEVGMTHAHETSSMGDDLALKRTKSSADEFFPSYATANGEALYASLSVADTTYQDPAKMNDFIEKLASYNEVKEVMLECSVTSKDSAVVSAAYVFPDKEEINLFARLLQAACSYEDTTPGYHLNFTHQQFFFCLEDPKNKRRYLWMAERINGNRILLFKTYSPLGTAMSAACYQDFRERITHTRFSSLNY